MPVDPTRARDLFLAAVDLTPAHRPPFLTARCGSDAALRGEVERLLAAHAEPAAVLDALSADPRRLGETVPGDGDLDRDTGTFGAVPSAGGGSDPAARTVVAGRYTLAGVIGEGGMGTVYRAEQTDPVKRTVALKLIKAGMDSKAVLARFDAERQALALMDHPNIARIYDGGVTPTGQPFFVMELVRGAPLTEYCDRNRLPVDARLGLFVSVCQAVQHAHQKGIIHRDLKPANVLVVEVDGRPTPKVIDFGVAKATGQKLTDLSLADTGAIVGTPAYMSPEQADPSTADVDTRTDVYALGVILYELLTGSPPISPKQFRRGAVLEILRMVREVDPPRPSTKLSTEDALPTIAANRGVEPAKLAKLLRGELDWVVMKAIEKDRTRRYESANGLARDVQRYLADEVVEARPPSPGYRLKKFVRRNPLQLALAAMVAMMVLGGGAVAWWQNTQLQIARERDGRTAEAVSALLDQCEEALRADDPAKAAVVLEAARKRSTEGGAETAADRIQRLDGDLALFCDLIAVDQFRWTWAENQWPDPAVVATRTRDALRRFGADPDAVPVDEAAARVAASVVRDRIVGALDRMLRQQKSPGMRALLQRVDADPYRDTIRDAVRVDDRAKLLELAGRPAALEQPPGFAAFLGESDVIAVGRRRQLLQMAVLRWPGSPALLMTLGNTYDSTRRDEADARMRWYQAAIAVAPANAAAHHNMGVALYYKGQPADAVPYFKKALDLDPKLLRAYGALRIALKVMDPADEAMSDYRKLIELDPGDGHNILGLALIKQGRIDEAVASFRKAVELQPTRAEPFQNLGHALEVEGQRGEAVACYRKVIQLSPNYAEAYADLGRALAKQGLFAESLAVYQRCDESRTNRPASAEWVRRAEALVAMEAKLPAFLTGEFRPGDNPERVGLAGVCAVKRLPRTAAGLYAAAFAAAANLSDDFNASLRYAAACVAATAAAGRGEDAGTLDDTERARLRTQALDWLRADLALRTRQLAKDTPITRDAAKLTLLHWQRDAELADLRDAAALAKLPVEERTAWTELWADVAALARGPAGGPLPAGTTPVMDFDRKAAEYVLSIGGAVKVSGENKEIKAVTDLPRGPFRLTVVDLHANPKVTDAGLAVFDDCKDVSILYFYLTNNLTNAGLAHFAGCKNLTQLHLQGTWVSNAGLARFKGSTAITDLYLSGPNITDEVLAYFKECKGLTHLGLYSTRVTVAGLRDFKDCQKLWYLDLNDTVADDECVAMFKGCKTLRSLSLNQTPVTDAGLVGLVELTNLVDLRLAKTRVTANGVEKLAKALPKCRITWDGGTTGPK
jgi:serine/threonine protein kinase/tetratricopeptide (TPR) repeat protein